MKYILPIKPPIQLRIGKGEIRVINNPHNQIGTSNFPQITDNGVSISQAQWDKMYPKGAPFHVTLKGKPE